MNIHESAEDYLEAILKLGENHSSVRSIDVASELGFSKASVSIAMKKLRESGYITVDSDGQLKLTKSGLSAAQRVYDRHKLFTSFFISLGVSPENAQADACKIEHDLSDETYEKLKAHIVKEHEKDGIS